MSIPSEPASVISTTDETAARREQLAARREQAAGEPLVRDQHDHREVIAAALVRVTTLAGDAGPPPGNWPGAQIGVTLQTVSAVNWLSAGRARGAA